MNKCFISVFEKKSQCSCRSYFFTFYFHFILAAHLIFYLPIFNYFHFLIDLVESVWKQFYSYRRTDILQFVRRAGSIQQRTQKDLYQNPPFSKIGQRQPDNASIFFFNTDTRYCSKKSFICWNDDDGTHSFISGIHTHSTPHTFFEIWPRHHATMGISGSEKCINKNGETQNI